MKTRKPTNPDDFIQGVKSEILKKYAFENMGK